MILSIPVISKFTDFQFVNRIFKIIIFLFMAMNLVGAQDCENDTIPPTIVCNDNYQFCGGWCGNEQFWANELIISVSDNCSPVKITFDEDGKEEEGEIGNLPFLFQGPRTSTTIYAHDKAGNKSFCTAYMDVKWPKIYNFPVRYISNSAGIDNKDFKILGIGEDGAEYIAFINMMNSNYELRTYHCNQYVSLKVDTVNRKELGYNVTGQDSRALIKYIINSNSEINNFNRIGLDSNCDGELNILDLLENIHYVFGDSLQMKNNCIDRPFALFLDEENEVLGSKIVFDENKLRLLKIGIGFHGDFNYNLIAPISNFKNPIREISGAPIKLIFPDIKCERDNTYEFEVLISDTIDLDGLQMNLSYDKDLIILDTNHLKKHQSTYAKDHDLRMIFTQKGYANSLKNKYTLKFKALDNFVFHEAFNTSIKTITNMASMLDGSIRPVEVIFSNSTQVQDELRNNILLDIQNASNKITIVGQLLYPSNYFLEINNIMGHKIFSEIVFAPNGKINRELEIQSSGIYCVQLKLPNGDFISKLFFIQ